MDLQSCHGYHTFGPLVRGCSSVLDFTIVFEAIFFRIFPSALSIALSCWKLYALRHAPNVVSSGRDFQRIKLGVAALFACLQALLLVFWSRSGSLRSPLTTAAAALSLVAALIFLPLSYVEHAREIRPSAVLEISLLCSTIFNIMVTRTTWLLQPATPLAWSMAVATGYQLVFLMVESVEKKHLIPELKFSKRSEDTSGILNRSFFLWVTSLLWTGAHQSLTPEDLAELPPFLRGNHLRSSFNLAWQKTQGRWRVLKAITRILAWRISGTVFARVVVLALTICQPILLQKLTEYLDTQTSTRNIGNGFIGAYALVYLGIAFSNGFYTRQHAQCLAILRSCLVSAISQKIMVLPVQDLNGSKAAISLANTDAEVIHQSLQNLHELWANLAQICIAAYLLQAQVGLACIAPIMTTMICTIFSILISRGAKARQTAWASAMQQRISVTSTVLPSLTSLKIQGLATVLQEQLQDLRIKEVHLGSKFRMLLVGTTGLAFTQQLLSPVLMYLFYIISAQLNHVTLEASTVFTALSLSIILTQPVTMLLQNLPTIFAALACFNRIEKFLNADEIQEFREFYPEPNPYVTQAKSECLERGLGADEDGAIGLVQLKAVRLRDGHPAIRVTNGSFSWEDGIPLLRSVNITIPRGRVTCIIGPVASGKSTLCKALLGEISPTTGLIQIYSHSARVSYCDQDIHLSNMSIKDSIVGFAEYDPDWYQQVLKACVLDVDFSYRTDQQEKKVGNDGSALSGGQRRRVALARAIYARNPITILDDAFRGLDNAVQHQLFDRLLGKQGLVRKYSMTVVLATGSDNFLPLVDHIIRVDSQGLVTEEGRGALYQESPLPRQTQSEITTTSDSQSEPALQSPEQKEEPKIKQESGGFGVFRYYSSAMGSWNLVALVGLAVGYAAFTSVSTGWLEIWTTASAGTRNLTTLGYWGIYATWRVLALISIVWFGYYSLTTVVARTGTVFHERVLMTAMNAPFWLTCAVENRSVLNRFSQDMLLIDVDLPFGMLALTSSLLSTVGQTILIVVSSPWIGIAIPILAFFTYFLQKFYLRTSRQLRLLDIESKSPLYGSFLEMVRGLPTIRAFGWQQQVLAMNTRLLDGFQKPAYYFVIVQRFLCFVIDLIIAIIAIMVVGLAVKLQTASAAVGVALTQLLSLSLLLSSTALSLVNAEISLSAIYRVKEFEKNTISEHQPNETTLPPISWPSRGSLKFRGVTASYLHAIKNQVLHNVSFSLQAGERLAVVGRTGSGKSSLILALLKLLDIQNGSIVVDDINIEMISRTALRACLTVVPQTPAFLTGTIRFNLDPRDSHTDADIIHALRQVRMLNAVYTVGGIDAVLQPEKFSHGQRQCLCLATAMLRKTRIVVLDEATDSVDGSSENEIHKIVEQAFSTCTLLVITHHLETITRFDKVAVMQDGRICEFGSPQELLNTDSEMKKLVAQGLEV